MKPYNIAVAGTGYVGMSLSVLLAQHNKVTAVDIIPERVGMINDYKSPIRDEYIERYQNGCRTDSLMMHVHGYVFTGKDGVKYTTLFKLNKTAKELLLSNDLHKVSPKCCKYLKKEPFKQFEKQTGKKAILGVRGGRAT